MHLRQELRNVEVEVLRWGCHVLCKQIASHRGLGPRLGSCDVTMRLGMHSSFRLAPSVPLADWSIESDRNPSLVHSTYGVPSLIICR